MASAKMTVTTREQWNVRSLELAQAKQLVGTARLLMDGPMERVYDVPNGDRRANGYEVRYVIASGAVRCTCVSGSYAHACSHAGAALAAERQREEATRQTGPDEAWSWWMHGGAWDD